MSTLARAWRVAHDLAVEGFAENEVIPADQVLIAAAALELRLADGSYQQRKAERVRKLLEAVYAGRLVAQLGPDGEIVVRIPSGAGCNILRQSAPILADGDPHPGSEREAEITHGARMTMPVAGREAQG